jgi:hypothetical protein
MKIVTKMHGVQSFKLGILNLRIMKCCVKYMPLKYSGFQLYAEMIQHVDTFHVLYKGSTLSLSCFAVGFTTTASLSSGVSLQPE